MSKEFDVVWQPVRSFNGLACLTHPVQMTPGRWEARRIVPADTRPGKVNLRRV